MCMVFKSDSVAIEFDELRRARMKRPWNEACNNFAVRESNEIEDSQDCDAKLCKKTERHNMKMFPRFDWNGL